MSVLGIVGSPRKGGNTELYMKLAPETCESEDLATELIHLSDYQVKPCNECLVCKTIKDCPIQDDFSGIYQKMLKAQGIILSSPVFFSSATPEIKALIDRAGYLGIAPLKERLAGPSS